MVTNLTSRLEVAGYLNAGLIQYSCSMVLALGRRKLSLRDLRQSGPGLPSSIVICVYRENLHDYEPSSQRRQSVD